MTDRLYSRMTRHAAYAAGHAVFALLAIGLGWQWLGIALLISFAPFLFAWGPYQANVTMNPALGEPDRSRWRIALYLLPWTMAAYWYLHIRR